MTDPIVNNLDQNLIETKIAGVDIYDGNLLHVKKDTVRLPNGATATREWVKHPGAAAVLPVTADGDVILVRQYRYPVQKITLEIPAGKLDHGPGENPLLCAQRELSEETGYRAGNYRHLTTLATTVGFSNEVIYIYLATGLTAGEQHTDDDEFINVVRLPLAEAVKKVWSGEICDGKSAVAILMAAALPEVSDV